MTEGRQVLVVTLALAACAVGGFLAYRTWEKSRLDQVEQLPFIEEAPTAAAQPESTEPAYRPLFTLSDIDGAERSITEWDGQILIINFWATWCAPCRREIPMLIQLQKDYDDRNVQVIGIAVDILEDVRDYASETPFNYPILVGEQEAIEIAGQFGVAFVGMPFTVVTDATGRIVERHTGELLEDQALEILATLVR